MTNTVVIPPAPVITTLSTPARINTVLASPAVLKTILASIAITTVLAAPAAITTVIEPVVITTTLGQQGVQGAQGFPGVPGGALLHAQASVALGGHRAVTQGIDGKLIYADASMIGHAGRVLGITTGAVIADDYIDAQVLGTMQEPSWTWTIGEPVFLGLNGQITQVVPTSPSVFSLILGIATSATSLFIRLATPILI